MSSRGIRGQPNSSGFGRGRGNTAPRGGEPVPDSDGGGRPPMNPRSGGNPQQSTPSRPIAPTGGTCWGQGQRPAAVGGNWPRPGENRPVAGNTAPPATGGPWGNRQTVSNVAPPTVQPGPSRSGPPTSGGNQRGQGNDPNDNIAVAARPERQERDGAPRGEGGRDRRRGIGVQPEEPKNSRDDIILSRKIVKEAPLTKKGTSGGQLPMISNYFQLMKRPNWSLYHYRVDFKPDEETTGLRKKLFRPHGALVGINIFDGYSLYTVNRLHPDPMTLYSLRDADQSAVELTVHLVGEISHPDPTMLQFYNIIIRGTILQKLGLEEIGRNFFDESAGTTKGKFKIWPGYVTSMRQCEENVLLRVEIKHKLIRVESVYDTLQSHFNSNYSSRESFLKEILNTVVMTAYNKKTYKISDIDWDASPSNTFDYKGEQITYIKYYKIRYDVTIKFKDQPLLVTRPKKRDIHRGDTGNIYLIPELCQTTGLTDSDRNDQRLMRDVADMLHISPRDRVEKVEGFMKRINNKPEIQEDLGKWGLKFKNQLVDIPGRVLLREKIVFSPRGLKQLQEATDKGEWSLQSKDYQMLKCASLKAWAIIMTERDVHLKENMVKGMQRVAGQLGFEIPEPRAVITVGRPGPQSYVKAIEDIMNRSKGNVDLIFSVLPQNKLDTYAAIKKRCYVDFGVPSQVVLTKNVDSGGKFLSIATKIVVQINSKLGGIPWAVEIPPPLNDTMMVGFDVYHSGPGGKEKSVGALVASTNNSWGEYYSTTNFHDNREELSSELCGSITKALDAYFKKNNKLPAKVIFFRDGVGEGQLSYVYHMELGQIKEALELAYEFKDWNAPKVRFTFIVVTKRIETRLFTAPQRNRGIDNPPPGAIVDDIITLPERHDFYLVSQSTRKGTVSPTSYHVLFDNSGLTPGNIQVLTYKMCHLYFNCSANVAVPAPCQYAHKLAYLTGIALNQHQCHEGLANQLYYL